MGLLGTAGQVLAASLTLPRQGARHLPTCRVGQWVDGYSAPDGAPCSPKCARVRAVVQMIADKEQTDA